VFAEGEKQFNTKGNMKKNPVSNGVDKTSFIPPSYFQFENNGWQCEIESWLAKNCHDYPYKSDDEVVWKIQLFPLGTSIMHEECLDSHDPLSSFEDAVSELIECTYFKPDCVTGLNREELFWLFRREGLKDHYSDEEVETIKKRILSNIKQKSKKKSKVKRESRNHVVAFRISFDDADRLQRSAKISGLTASSYLAKNINTILNPDV